jgi:putative PEP-CTERM system histidine kinase
MLRPGKATVTAPRIRLRLAALATVAWSVLAWWADTHEAQDAALAQLLSLSLACVWIWQLEPLARWQGQPRWMRQCLRWSGVFVVMALLAWMLAASQGVVDSPPRPGLLSVVGIALCAFGLFTIEQIYRNAVGAEPALRWLGLGEGGILVAQLVMFSETLVLGQVPGTNLQVHSAIYALCAIAIFRGARTMPDWSFGFSVSRKVVFYTSSFMLVGGYLVLMGLVAWLLLTYAGGWHPAAQLGFSVLAAATLALSMFSQGLLRRLKVYISSHFYPHRYDYRAEWLRFTQTLAGHDEAEGVPGRAIRAVAQIVGSGRGSLWRLDESGRYELAQRWPVAAASETLVVDADDALPAYLASSGWLVDLAELRRAPGLYQELVIDARRYAAEEDALIVPLLHRDRLYGWIVLERPPGLGALDYEDRDLLKTAGRHVAAYLSQFDSDARLVQARQFETYNRMTAFVMHDLKNVAAQLRLISQNAERHRRNPEFVDDAFRTISSSADRMTKLVSQLGSGADSGTMQTVDLATAAERAALRCGGQVPVPQVSVTSRPLVFADLERLAAVIEHAIRNAQDATPSHGEVRVEIGVREGQPQLAVSDTGTGMDPQFIRDRLFRPFDTTKGTRGMGIGAFQIREYITSLGGRIEVQSEPGRGTTLRLYFARAPAQVMALASG